jgi:hypothetical protein
MRHHISCSVLLVGLCLFSPALNSQIHTSGSKDHPIKISTVTDTTNQSSADMMNAFRKKIASHPNLFALVSNSDSSVGLVLIADCITRDTPNDTYVCSYESFYAGGAGKTFLGGGVSASKSAMKRQTNCSARWLKT